MKNDSYTNRRIIVNKKSPIGDHGNFEPTKGRSLWKLNSKRKYGISSIESEDDLGEKNTIGWTFFLVIFILALLAFVWYMKRNEIMREEAAMKIHLDLEQKANEIDLLILRSDFEKALKLAGDLNHPKHELYKARSESGVDFSSGDLFPNIVYFDTYWDHVRDSLKKEIKDKLNHVPQGQQ
ncbi:MAG: hypothetical protein RIT42_310 [Bacteroidota bacterium]|jgi:hypothetical protein